RPERDAHARSLARDRGARAPRRALAPRGVARIRAHCRRPAASKRGSAAGEFPGRDVGPQRPVERPRDGPELRCDPGRGRQWDLHVAGRADPDDSARRANLARDLVPARQRSRGRVRGAPLRGSDAGSGVLVVHARGLAQGPPPGMGRSVRLEAGQPDRPMSSPDASARRMMGRERTSMEAQDRRGSASTAITVARVIFVSLVGYGGYLLVESFQPPARWLVWASLGVLGGLIAGVAVVALEQAARRLPMSRLFLSAIGALGGVLLAQIVASALIVFLPGAGTAGGRGFLSLLLAYMGVVFVLRREEELGGITRIVFPGATAGDARYKVLDTSVIIDGRIADVCEAGFLEGTLLVPQYVLRELQQIADSSDPLKRNRGRRGLDVLQRLQRLPEIRTELHDLDFPHIRE